ncbi:MAG: hypothetical protein J6W64_08075 [Bacilli bacterium]|nr:hypothetical protein [Bacilli bacterium]
METNEIRIKELEDLIDDVVDLEQCKVLKEDIEASTLEPKDKFSLRQRLAITELCLTLMENKEI